jgi:GNAT superfamily N-acetyltransferase
MRETVTVRPLEPSDLAAVAAIDERLTGQSRKEYWRTRFDIAALRPPWMSSIAELDGRVVGFLFGWVGDCEFGITVPTGWIDLVGVHPAYRGRGVGRALVDRFVTGGRELRAIRKVATLIDLDQADIREFFVRRGFRHGPMVQLERSLDPERAAGAAAHVP